LFALGVGGVWTGFSTVIEPYRLTQHPRLVVANNVEHSVAPNLAKITASRI
jgi:hypothetical protein